MRHALPLHLCAPPPEEDPALLRGGAEGDQAEADAYLAELRADYVRPWPSPMAFPAEDLLRWQDVWTARDGVHVTPPPEEGEALCRVSRAGAWEVRADVAALLGIPRYGAERGAVEAIPVVHRQLWEGRRKLRLGRG